MKIDTWEVKDELSDDDPSVSADNRPSDREANMVSKITETEIPKSSIPVETKSFDTLNYEKSTPYPCYP